MIFNMTGGSKKPENPLNVAVVSYASESELIASTPEDTTVVTIGVVTTTPITGWCFSPLQPPNMATGEVWFGLDLTSPVEFNALKTNRILLAPTRAQQMVSGSLREVAAKSYLNGKWVDWISTLYLYNNGIFSELAGTITSVAKKVSNKSGGKHTLTINASNVTVGTEGGSGAWVYFPNKIDLTNYKTLYFNGAFNLTHSEGGNGRFGFGVWSEEPKDSADTQAVAFYGLVAPPLPTGVYTLDIESLKGKYYVGMALYGYGTSAQPYTQAVLNQMWVE